MINKSKCSIRLILDYESSAFTRTGMQFWNLRCTIWVAKDERDLAVVECINIMVCSQNLIMVGFIEKFRDLKPEYEGGNWFSFDAAINGPAVVCRKVHIHCFRWEWSHSCCDVGNCYLLLLGTGAFIINFTANLQESIIAALPCWLHCIVPKGLYASITCNFDEIWAFNIYLMPSSVCWQLFFLHCNLWTSSHFLLG